MPKNVQVRRVHVLRTGAMVLAACLLQSCLSYDETGTLHADGTGEVRIAFGIVDGKADPEKIREVRHKVKSLRGLHWLADVDSSSTGRHWFGARLGFDSLQALRGLNAALPTENLFSGVKFFRTDSGTVFHRSAKPISGSKDQGDAMRVRWTFPGKIEQTDRHASVDTATRTASWWIPVDGSAGEWASMSVRYETAPLSFRRPLGRLSDILSSPMAKWMAFLALANLLGAVAAAARIAHVRRELSNRG